MSDCLALACGVAAIVAAAYLLHFALILYPKTH